MFKNKLVKILAVAGLSSMLMVSFSSVAVTCGINEIPSDDNKCIVECNDSNDQVACTDASHS